jgi:hypothetical protein
VEVSKQQRLQNSAFLGLSEDLEIIVVLKRTQSDVISIVKPILCIDNNVLMRTDNGQVAARIKSASSWEPTSVINAGSVGTAFIAGMSYDKSQIIAYSNGVAGTPVARTDDMTNDGVATNLNINYFGGSGDFAISELIIYRKKLNDSMRAQIVSYLKSKWSIV